MIFNLCQNRSNCFLHRQPPIGAKRRSSADDKKMSTWWRQWEETAVSLISLSIFVSHVVLDPHNGIRGCLFVARERDISPVVKFDGHFGAIHAVILLAQSFSVQQWTESFMHLGYELTAISAHFIDSKNSMQFPSPTKSFSPHVFQIDSADSQSPEIWWQLSSPPLLSFDFLIM